MMLFLYNSFPNNQRKTDIYTVQSMGIERGGDPRFEIAYCSWIPPDETGQLWSFPAVPSPEVCAKLSTRKLTCL